MSELLTREIRMRLLVGKPTLCIIILIQLVLVGCKNQPVNQITQESVPTKKAAVNSLVSSHLPETKPKKDQFEIGWELIKQRKFAQAELSFRRSFEHENDSRADVELAVFSYQGEFSYYSKQEAESKLDTYKLTHKRAAEIVLMGKYVKTNMILPSITDYYLEHKFFDDKYPGIFPDRGPPNDEAILSYINDINGDDWLLSTEVDEMTDQRKCQLISYKNEGVAVGLTNTGIFFSYDKALSFNNESMGIRVDKGNFYTAQMPESKKRFMEYSRAISMQVIAGDISAEIGNQKVNEFLSRYKPEHQNYYFINIEEPSDLISIIKEIAAGQVLRVRVIDESGNTKTVKFELHRKSNFIESVLGLAPSNETEERNIFDIYAFGFLKCLGY